MKPTDTLTTLFSHNLWANKQLLERCAELSREQMDATVVGTYGSIRETLLHLVLAEHGYFSRISTGERYRRPKDAESMTISDMIASVEETGSGLIEWAHKVQAEDKVTVDADGTPLEVPKTIILTQVINHATEHRAQIMVIMTQLGVQPPELDAWTYAEDLANRAAR
jgi:uncharacterized damage-inducible protein DinB